MRNPRSTPRRDNERLENASQLLPEPRKHVLGIPSTGRMGSHILSLPGKRKWSKRMIGASGARIYPLMVDKIYSENGITGSASPSGVSDDTLGFTVPRTR